MIVNTRTINDSPNQDTILSHQPVVFYGGLSRPGYFGWGFVLLIGAITGYGVSIGLSSHAETAGGILLVLVSIAVFAAGIGLHASRMDNMGMTLGQKVIHLLLLIIPLVGIYPTLFLASAPTGYMQHRKYDTAGKVLIALMLVFYIAIWVTPLMLGVLSRPTTVKPTAAAIPAATPRPSTRSVPPPALPTSTPEEGPLVLKAIPANEIPAAETNTFSRFDSHPPAGEVRTYAVLDRVINFEIRTKEGMNHLVRLYDSASDRLTMSVFVEGGKPQHVKVPVGSFRIKFASGLKWYNYTTLFGKSTIYTRAEETFDFVEGWKYWAQLYTSPDGNFTIKRISADDF